MGKVIFIRHGHVEADDLRYLPDMEVALSSTGLEQAAHVARDMNTLTRGTIEIITSPNTRAQQTAKIISDGIRFSKVNAITIDQLTRNVAGLIIDPYERHLRARTFMLELTIKKRHLDSVIVVSHAPFIKECVEILTGNKFIEVGHCKPIMLEF